MRNTLALEHQFCYVLDAQCFVKLCAHLNSMNTYSEIANC